MTIFSSISTEDSIMSWVMGSYMKSFVALELLGGKVQTT